MSKLCPVPRHYRVVSTLGGRALRRTCVVAILGTLATLLPGDLLATEPTVATHQVPSQPRRIPSRAPGEPYITPKAAATAWVEEVGSWDDGNPAETPTELRATARTARTVVETAQLADIPGTDTSVIVIARQTLEETPTENRVREVSLEVDLAPTMYGWSVMHPLEATPKEKPRSRRTSPNARRVLDNLRVALSTPARRDVEAGDVDDRLLDLLSELACRQRLDISFFVTGYRGSGGGPSSQHASGRAADVRAIDAQPITPELAEGALGLMQAANRAGAVATGPILIDGASSATNSDHIHIGLP